MVAVFESGIQNYRSMRESTLMTSFGVAHYTTFQGFAWKKIDNVFAYYVRI
jgi:hypothetical protein